MLQQFNSDVCHKGNLEKAEGICISIVKIKCNFFPSVLRESAHRT